MFCSINKHLRVVYQCLYENIYILDTFKFCNAFLQYLKIIVQNCGWCSRQPWYCITYMYYVTTWYHFQSKNTSLYFIEPLNLFMSFLFVTARSCISSCVYEKNAWVFLSRQVVFLMTRTCKSGILLFCVHWESDTYKVSHSVKVWETDM